MSHYFMCLKQFGKLNAIDKETLDDVEQLFVTICNINNLAPRLKSLVFKLQSAELVQVTLNCLKCNFLGWTLEAEYFSINLHFFRCCRL
jgi:hypothetical protein